MTTKPFEIGLVMAGAISAGAYSAGVMDFIIEALDKYYEAKQRNDWDGPRHDVYVPVLAGASAGGMTAAIIALQAFRTIKHVLPGEDPPAAALNRLYSSWVTDIDIKRLLEINDPREREAVQSVLCCKVLDEIVAKAFVGDTPNKKRPWIGRDDDPLRVFLTVTNLRGLPCSFELFGDENRYGMLNHGDYLDFTVGSKSVAAPGSLALDIDDTTGADWELFRTAAVATGAFPIGLRPRAVNRKAADYSERKECGLDECISGETDYRFVAVDGGMETRSFRYGEDSDLPLKMFFRDENQEQPDTPGFPIIPLVPELCEPIKIGPSDWPQPTLINLDTLEPFIDERMSFVARAVVANELGNLEDALQKKRSVETGEPNARRADAAEETANTWNSIKSFAEDGVACVKRLSSKLGRTVLREAASRYGARIAAQVARDQVAEARDEVERAFKP